MTPRLQAPIVLVHGIFGFDEIRMGGYTFASYFRNIPCFLRSTGNRVLVPALSPTGGIAYRAEQLKAFIDKNVPNEPVHLMAHSMGGLDARYMIARLGMAGRVITLTTIATPHRGTTFADWGIRYLGGMVKPFLLMFGIPTEGFYDLTTERCRRFNEQVPDAPGVRYFSVAGKYATRLLHPEWLLPARVVRGLEGANDGIVSVASATYGEHLEVWDGDHLNLINCYLPSVRLTTDWRDVAPRYGRLVRRLADEGF
jgi:triacylglycerol lipase